MPRPQFLADKGVLGQGQIAARRHDLVLADDHRTVMKRGVGNENINQQLGGNIGFQRNAGLNIIRQARLPFEYDQGADLALG
ncbi:hypothetical protein D3C76_1509450 [compost metagenome]